MVNIHGIEVCGVAGPGEFYAFGCDGRLHPVPRSLPGSFCISRTFHSREEAAKAKREFHLSAIDKWIADNDQLGYWGNLCTSRDDCVRARKLIAGGIDYDSPHVYPIVGIFDCR